jgi:hypothetical protein
VDLVPIVRESNSLKKRGRPKKMDSQMEEVVRTILTPKNEEVYAINLMALNKLPGSAVELNGCDSIVEGNDRLYPVELLNSLKPSRMPLNRFPIMLLRNIIKGIKIIIGNKSLLNLIILGAGSTVVATKPTSRTFPFFCFTRIYVFKLTWISFDIL